MPVAKSVLAPKPPLPLPSSTLTVLASVVRRHQVLLAVAVEVGDRHRVGGRARGEVGRAKEAAAPVAEQHSDGTIILGHRHQVLDAVAVEVADGDREAGSTVRRVVHRRKEDDRLGPRGADRGGQQQHQKDGTDETAARDLMTSPLSAWPWPQGSPTPVAHLGASYQHGHRPSGSGVAPVSTTAAPRRYLTVSVLLKPVLAARNCAVAAVNALKRYLPFFVSFTLAVYTV